MSGSSLKFFAKAKNSVSGIVSDLLELLSESRECASEIHSVDQSILTEDDLTLTGKLAEKVKGISDILQRNSMKVVFFGRTSNGKSTVINAMLKDKILPSGIGHTTNCFVQVEGQDGSEAYIATEGAGKQSVQSLGHLASALSKVKLTPESLIKIHWPKHKCHLLQEDVVLVDSPGIDLSADTDEWIDKFCLDADVFVLVANAESTIMQTEKNFFHRVSSRLSKPNIFILNNRWDASAYEIDTKKEVRQQHVERCTSFLVNELQVMDLEDVGKRVFFVSALEMLQVGNSLAVPHQLLQPSEGVEERIDEFAKFEECFEDCISKTAVETKFAQHARNVGSVASSLVSTWDEIIVKVDQARGVYVEDLEASKCLLDSIDEDFVCWQELAKGLVVEASQHLKYKMSQSLTKELKYLYNVLDEYGQTFNPDDEEAMRLYRKDLNFYVEENLIKNLHVSHTPVARATFLETCDQMIASACTMLSMSEEEVVRILVPSRNFEVIYNLDCTGLCSEFIEDIEFRFSLGVTALLTKYMGKGTTDDCEVAQLIASGTSSSTSLLPFTSGSTIGMLVLLSAVGFFVFRMVGSRVMVICLSAYALLYVYERLAWTNKMKEQAFKRQYISFVTHQLRTVMDILSSNCSQQIERELNCVMKDLHAMIVKHRDLLTKKIQESERLVKKLENIGASAASLRSRFYNISRRLEEFQTEYLRENS